MFDFFCDLLGHEIVTEFTGCRRIVRTEQGQCAFDGTVYVTEDGVRWIRVDGQSNAWREPTHYLHGDKVCNHP